ncbi:MAG: ABC transporter permease subunit [Candidatus Gastranaerophilales bacterium]|nr:ABC transporter permease subunit [Candidatus Gastranaerophilales bacterium]
MHNLLRAELFRVRKSFVYKLIVCAYLIYEICYNRNEVSNGILYTGISYTGIEWFSRMPAETSYIRFMWVFVAIVVAGDYGNRTYAASFLCGYPRKKVLAAKIVVFFMEMVPIMLIHIAAGTVIWTMRYGFGAEVSIDTAMTIVKSLLYCIFSLAVFGSTYIFLSVLAQNTIGAIGMSFGITQAIGILLGNLSGMIENPILRKPFEFVLRFSILTQLGELKGGTKVIPVPFWQTAFSSVIVTFFMFSMAIYIFNRQDMR